MKYVQYALGHAQTHCMDILLTLKMMLATTLLLLTTAEATADSEKHYQQCAACHLNTGAGVSGMFPSLTSRLGPLADTQKGRDYLVVVLQAGLMGRLSIEGGTYQGVMPAQGPSLGDQGIASVLNYVLRRFNADTLNKEFNLFTAKEVAGIKGRHATANNQAILILRQSAFAEK